MMIYKFQKHVICGLLFFALGLLIADWLPADETVGLKKLRPKSGRFVKTDRGFMVPYKTKIPGTEIDYEMVPIPAGEYMMGSPPAELGHTKHESPQIKVTVQPFWMSKYELTWNEYKEFMMLNYTFKDFESQGIRRVTKENKIDAVTAPSGLYDEEIVFEKGGGDNQPAVMMTQFSARQYTKWLGLLSGRFYRLPTAAEWEYACRAGTTTAYHFGDSPERLGDYAWFEGNSEDSRHDVGQKKPNPWGLYDMHGSVAEWVIDTNDGNGYSKWKGRTIVADKDIRWPKSLDNQIVRGGSFEMKKSQCRSASILFTDEEAWKDEEPSIPLTPWWFTSEPATGVGMRVIRPFRSPKKKAERQKFWGPDVVESLKNAESIISSNGRGAYGIVDKNLPKAIEGLFKKK